MKKLLERSAIYYFTIGILSLITLFPFSNFPGHFNDDFRIITLFVAIIVSLMITYIRSKNYRIHSFRFWTRLSIITLLSNILLTKTTILNGFTTSMIARYFQFDGETAYDAMMYEAFLEIWFVLALITFVFQKLLARYVRIF